MLKNNRELDNEIRMLQGNINRICITKDYEEMLYMFDVAKYRIEQIFFYNKNKINKQNE